jgi:hypothetical protein
MAAGLGFKTFTTGEVLTAADVNGYLMQGVLVFADAAARDAAITSPQEGQFAYLKDTDVTTYYTSSAWANLDTTGMTNPMTTTADMIYSSSGSTPERLGIGTVGQVLTVNSGATAPEWAAPSSGSMTQLATGTLSGSTLTLSSISASYQDLLLVCNNFYPSANSYLSIKVNNTADIYARTSTTSSSNPINTAQIDFSNSEVYNADKDNYLAFRIDNYANTTSNKFGFENWILGNTGGTSWNIGQAIDAIRTTSAINRIDLILTAGSFSAGTYTLYGVK